VKSQVGSGNGGPNIKSLMMHNGAICLPLLKRTPMNHQNVDHVENINDVTNTIFLGLGSNLDDPINQIGQAIDSLSAFVQSIRRAPLYRSKPLGPQDQPDFVNTVIQGQTGLAPNDLLDRTQQIETSQGRIKTMHWGPRTIDIDILYFENLRFMSPTLTIPHQEILNRSFVVIPLLDLLPNQMTPTGDRIERNRYDASTLVRIDT
jgi:2-amino-4-hydroxy-6-hydroxymethyldihydropteridine diphosphokinase